MKKILLLVALAFMSSFATAQTFNYQAAARDAGGDLITGGNLGVQVRILSGSDTGPAVFAETWNVTTNANGVFDLAIGNGTNVSGDLLTLDWGNTDYFLEIAIDEDGGIIYQVVGASELRVVPVAMTSLQFEEQVGTTNVIQLASTVVGNTAVISNLNNSDANQEIRIIVLEGQNLDARLTIAESSIAQNTADIAAAELAAVTTANAYSDAQDVIQTGDLQTFATDADTAQTTALQGEIATAQAAAEATASADATAKVLVETNRATAAEAVNAGNITTNATAIGVIEGMSGDATLTAGDLQLEADSVGANELANNAVDAGALQDNSVTGGTGGTIADNTITAEDIGIGAITASELATGAVEGGPAGDIFDGSITKEDLNLADVANGLDGAGLATDTEVAALTTANVAASTDKNYVTDAEATVIANTSGTNTGDQNASQVVSTATTNIAATNVDAAIAELDTEKAPLASPSFTGNVNTTGDLHLKSTKIISNDGFGRVEFFNTAGEEFIEFNGTNINLQNKDVLVQEKLGIGIGDTVPTADLDVAGTVKIVDGTQGAGKVLTSDATGNATWATPTGPAASAITSTATTNIAATNVDAAISELDTEKASLAGATFTGNVTFSGGLSDVNLGVNNINLTAGGSTVFDGADAVSFENSSVVFNTATATFNQTATFNEKVTISKVLSLTPSAAPATPANGDMYFDGTDLKLFVAGAWKTVQLL